MLHFLFLLYCFKNFENCERKYIYLITKINSIKYVYKGIKKEIFTDLPEMLQNCYH